MISFSGGAATLFFVAFIGVFIFILFKIIKQGIYNRGQPQIPAQARVVARRKSTHHHNHNGHIHHSHTYYVTFEYANGQRSQLAVPAGEYNRLPEGITGTLTTQGTKYISFSQE